MGFRFIKDAKGCLDDLPAPEELFNVMSVAGVFEGKLNQLSWVKKYRFLFYL